MKKNVIAMSYKNILDKTCPNPVLPNSIAPQDCKENITVLRLIVAQNGFTNPFTSVADFETESNHSAAIGANTIAYTSLMFEYKANPGTPIEENSDNNDSVILDATDTELVFTFSGLNSPNEEALKEMFNYQDKINFWIVERSGKTIGLDVAGVPTPFVAESSFFGDRALFNTSTSNKNILTIKMPEGWLSGYVRFATEDFAKTI